LNPCLHLERVTRAFLALMRIRTGSTARALSSAMR
jgi:hypothetical protein